MEPRHPPSENPELDALIAQYLETVDRGERPDRQQYLEAHPEHAAGLAAFLDDLDKMQAANEQAGPELARTFLAPQGSPGTKPGTIIGGRYKLLENIGEGGMGSVWVAEQQQPVKRRVAIKLIKAGMDSRQVLARFDAERQALAVMDHPNIAKVFDGGMTEQGRPYFVMEYVKGVPFTEYCDKARLSLKDRLTLFIPVCQAVQHAHHKGIVHRDLKPSNILICLYDGRPVPKVIDFGLAKAMHQSLTDQSIYTGHGVMVGTPLYMSPEQAEHNNLDVDTRTDIYSLGVVLYELLTGTTPLERQQLQQAAFEEVRRLIQEVEPPRPSIRLSGSAGLPSIAAQRSIDPKQLSRSLAGDLDWIVMKALEKERSRRYETATGLARDIERFLNEEAVEACPPSRSYRLKKFLRKHRGQVIAASVVLLALIVGITGTTWGLIRATKAEHAATESEHKTLKALDQVTQERDAKDLERKKAEAAANSERTAKLAESEQRTKAERQLVSGILRPIGFNTSKVFDPAELKSLTDWSGLGDSRLQLLALEIAFEDPATALRVARRAERVIQSTVGLSPTRRAKAIEFVSAQQRDMAVDHRIRIAACWLALELGSPDLPALEESIAKLSDPNTKLATELYEFVTFAIARIDSQPQSEASRRLSDALIAVLEKSADEHALRATADGLRTLAPRLEPAQITPGGNALIAVLEKATDRYVLSDAGNGLTALIPKLEPAQVTRGWDALIALLEKTTDTIVLSAARNGLVALAPRLEPAQVSHGWDALIALLEKPTDTNVLSVARNGLVALAPSLEPAQVSRDWDALIALLKKTTDGSTLYAVGGGLAALAPRLEAARVINGGDILITVIENSTHSSVLFAAREGLVALTPKLRPKQVTRGWDALIAVLERSTDEFVLREAREGLVALAPKLEPAQVTRSWDVLIAVLENSTDSNGLDAAGGGLAALAPRLEPDQVTRGGDALIAVLENSTDSSALYAARKGLVSLAPKLEPAQFTRGWDALIVALEKSTSWNELYATGEGLAALAPRLEPAQVARGWDALIAVLENSTNHSVLFEAEEVLVALTARLEPAQVPRSWDALIRILEKSTDKYALRGAQGGLVAMAPRLGSAQATRGWDALIAVLENSTDVYVLKAAGNGLVALAPKLEPAQATRGAETLTAVLEKPTSWIEFYVANDGLAALAPRLEPSTRDRILTQAMTVMLDDTSSSGHFFPGDDGNVVRFIGNPKSLAKLFSHPGCVGELRQALLQRFEELLFHDGKPVFLTKPEPETEAQPSPPPRPEPPPRRFHNLHDAAAWIQQNWPDFDLETNHPVTWRSPK